MQEFDFIRASSLEEAGQLLTEPGSRLIAGGTDVLPQLQRGQFTCQRLIDISDLDELRFIRQQDGWIEVGALISFADLMDSPYLQRTAPSVLEAAATVGCPQTRNRGTLGGNIANASPAGDTLPPLLSCEGRVHILREGERVVVPLKDFFTGPGQTVLAPEDVLCSVSFRPLGGGEEALFLKLGNRKGMNIAVASVALRLHFSPPGKIQKAWVAVGSVAPTPIRSYRTEEVLRGAEANEETLTMAAKALKQDIQPIDDVRASAQRRRESSAALLKRGLRKLFDRRIPS